ncbi:MAG TPA: hypothetical protein VHQ47_12460 [Phycisphaerae bacterium]|nr:hypothetical protein [Phycisphaerae bacterium]HWB96979.1 hypothetical protein [Bryobacteraceae bacterium]
MTHAPHHPSAESLRHWVGGSSIAGAMQIWHAGILGVVLIGFGLATYFGFRQMTYQRVDAQFQQAV